MESYQNLNYLKYVIIGSSGTGKTTFLLKLTNKTFNPYYSETFDLCYKINTITLDDTIFDIQIPDSDTQNKTIPILASFFKGSHCIFIIYNPSDIASFEKLTEWICFTKHHAPTNTKIVIVENRFEDENIFISKGEIYEIIRSFELQFVSINAKTGDNVRKIFYDSLCCITRKNIAWIDPESTNPLCLESDILKSQDQLCKSFQVEDYDLFFKCIVIGDSFIGKSSIIKHLCDNIFPNEYFPTFESNFYIKKIKINNLTVKLQMYDTSGHERFQTLALPIFKEPDCIIIVYSSCNRKSFDNIINWLENIDKYSSKNCQVILLENEFDMCLRQVQENEGQRLAKKFSIPLFRLNAKNSSQIQSSFTRISEILINSSNYKKPSYIDIIKKSSANNKSKNKKSKNESKPRIIPNIKFHVFLLLGDSGTGKSALSLRFCENIFNQSYIPTISIDSKIINKNIQGYTIKIKIRDTSGREFFTNYISAYCQSSNCIMIIYDTSKRETFTNLRYWIKGVEGVSRNNYFLCLVENENSDKPRQVEIYEGEDFARRYNMIFFRVNVKENEGVNEALEECVLKISRNFNN
ncbi:hypothetical protein SteCoe_2964 [Stentor coeruleus]|uniref:Uncharacterized protein n=1 Tax=Stentor coeruleus TaxID=5963 RepID=A0A1R2CY40_9CILI|nr:hypothetical protein SteCoe_2964 [Stentor coeruleus]